MIRLSLAAFGLLLALPAAVLAQGLSGPSTAGVSGSAGAMPGAAMPGLSGGPAASPPSLAGINVPAATATPSATAAPLIGTVGEVGASGSIVTHQGIIYETQQIGDATKGFMTIVNEGSADDKLTGLSCPIADSTTLVGADGKPVTKVDVAPNKPAMLTTNGPHLTLQGTHFLISHGSVIPCTLTFQNAGQVQVFLEARKQPAS